MSPESLCCKIKVCGVFFNTILSVACQSFGEPMDVNRVFVEKRKGFDLEAQRLKAGLTDFLGPQFPCLARLEGIRILQRYDVQGLTDEQFKQAVDMVFSEPQCDAVYIRELPLETEEAKVFFGIEYLPGQYDQKADSAEQCIELAVGTKPLVRCARFYILKAPGPIQDAAMAAVKAYLINPVDSREVEFPFLGPSSPEQTAAAPGDIPVLTGFRELAGADLDILGRDHGLSMTTADLAFCRDYFIAEKRDPTLTELRVLDAYWSDHCRHTTFTTILRSITISDPGARGLHHAVNLYEDIRRELYGPGSEAPPRTLMDLATIGARALQKRGLLPDLDQSAEINACTVRVNAGFTALPGGDSAERTEPWLLLFKNETHNHPTEIEPFGGAATCLGGAIRDPLSGRAYVHQAMRISGGADPRRALTKTLPGKLPQLKIAREAAAGYSSYGNQIGIATGQVTEVYHEGYLAKRLELGAVIGAAPVSQVRRSEPLPGDPVILIGGKTGRDGIGGATGSSKAHTGKSVESAGAEVQKGNAVEERKLQRLFRNPRASLLIKRCNDFGAGGVSVAVGELAPGLDINLDAIPKKYTGLDGTELAVSESQERMAVVVSPDDAPALIELAAAENLDAVVIATVSGRRRLRMNWRGKTIVDISRDFLDSTGPSRFAEALIRPGSFAGKTGPSFRTMTDKLKDELSSLRSCSRRGLQERFDGTVGAGSVLFPWGGKEQGTPECGMAALLPAPVDRTSLTASLMCFGFDPHLSAADPYRGAKGAVKEALAKYACLGGDPWKARLSMQEYFEKPESREAWGRPLAALLGALEAQIALGVPAIGGKDSMSGSYRDPPEGVELAVPPTVVVFAAGTVSAASVRSGALSGEPGNPVILLYAEKDTEKEEEWDLFKAQMNALGNLTKEGLAAAAYPVGAGGIAAALALMAFGNMTGVEVRSRRLDLLDEQTYPGAVLVEINGKALEDPAGESSAPGGAKLSALLKGASWTEAARTIAEPVFRFTGPAQGDSPKDKDHEGVEEIALEELRRAWEEPLSQVYPPVSGTRTPGAARPLPVPAFAVNKPAFGRTLPRPAAGSGASVRPLVVLPVFPGTNGEWDMERAFLTAGARTRPVVFRNRSAADIRSSIRELAEAVAEAQIIALSGGFSSGDEPDGSGKFIANVFRTPEIAEGVNKFLDRGLILGICNGFQALIKLGLVPYGRYTAASVQSPTLTFNRIGRHVSRMVRTRVMPSASPWLALEEPGTIHVLPVSHGEGRLVAAGAEELFKARQVPFCYADAEGRPAAEEPDNPNGSDFAIEGLTSPDGRILGKMGHSERTGPFLYTNIPGNKAQRIFEAGVRYFL
ncbi:MAG: phosphoribosylformylglycinamidine synthase [Spirochaetaceae bacterium]|jgi:phosphoribosylformylglycinamidine synthase|nr:phosphoribosylformylglycinamidine synthase [Spirochaetaceae bacterium]